MLSLLLIKKELEQARGTLLPGRALGLMKGLMQWVRGTCPQRHHLRAHWEIRVELGVRGPAEPFTWLREGCDQRSKGLLKDQSKRLPKSAVNNTLSSLRSTTCQG